MNHFRKCARFEWQEASGCVQLFASGDRMPTVAYIRNQAAHHHARSFRDDFGQMLQRHGFDYDERMLAAALSFVPVGTRPFTIPATQR